MAHFPRSADGQRPTIVRQSRKQTALVIRNTAVTDLNMLEAQPIWIPSVEQTAHAGSALVDNPPSAWLGIWSLVIGAIVVLVVLTGGVYGLMLYQRAKRREAAQWMHDIFQRFQLGKEFDRGRWIFDFEYRDAVEPALARLVAGGNASCDAGKRSSRQAIDRLLNYLEQVVYLADSGYLSWSDCLVYFKHSFDLLSAPERGALRRYLIRFGFERLARIARAGPDDFLLLYGSLSRQEPKHNELGLDKSLEFVGLREVSGSLYDLGEYPGIILGRGVVLAELFKIRDMSILSRLDEYEEYDDANPANSLFRRTTVQMARYRSRLANRVRGNPMIDAWVYIYNRPIDGKERIEGRSWQEHKLNRQEPEFPPG